MTSSARNLEHKSIEELSELSNNDIALIEMVSTDETLQSVQLEVQTAQENNKMLAEENIAFSEKIPALRNQLCSLHESISQTTELLSQMIAQYDSLSLGSTRLDDVADQLKITASEADEKSEKIAEEFLDKKIDLDEFLQSYKESRKNAHIARIFSDKFADKIEDVRSERQSATRAPKNSLPTSQAPLAYGNAPLNTPYSNVPQSGDPGRYPGTPYNPYFTPHSVQPYPNISARVGYPVTGYP